MTWRAASALHGEVLPRGDVQRPANPAGLKAYNERLARATELPLVIPRLEHHAVEWRYQNYGYQFKFPSGPILCWWPRTGAILWQGNNLPSDLPITSIEAAVDAFEPVAPPTVGISVGLRTADLLEKPVCLVCGALAATLFCNVCAQDRGDLCDGCWTFAHWC